MARMLKTCLKRWPLQTNVGIYATFYTAAELSQQIFNKFYTPEQPEMDFKAAARLVAVGGCLYAPTLFFWYKLLDGKFPGNSPRIVATKVVLDQAVLTPILLALFFIILGVLEGKDDIYSELREKYWMTFVYNQCFWIPGQTINFAFVPAQLRIVFISCASFLWINVICFIKRQKLPEELNTVQAKSKRS